MNGVAKVLSHTASTRCRCASAATAARSTSFSSGLVGVSTQTMRVSGRSAASSAAVSDRSTNATWCPAERLRTFSNSR